MTNFKRELQAAGYESDTDQFYCCVASLFTDNFPNHTDEQLKREPREALRFCEIVRERLELSKLTDQLILGALENFRKHRKQFEKIA